MERNDEERKRGEENYEDLTSSGEEIEDMRENEEWFLNPKNEKARPFTTDGLRVGKIINSSKTRYPFKRCKYLIISPNF